MRRAIAMALLASTLLAGHAAAQPHAKAKGGDAAAAETSARSMDAPYLAVPVVRDGQLVNYLFVSVRFDIAQGVDLWHTREQAHLLRHALVRACHQNALADPNDNNRLDERRAIEVFRTTAMQVLGERAIRNVSIVATYSSQSAAL